MWKLIAIAITCPLCLSGCNTSNERDTAPVHGRVTLDGAPLTTGTVYFTPHSGRGAKGEVKPDGAYVLSTYGDEDGAIIGRHKVFILAVVDAEIESTEPVISLVPQRYTSPETSGFEFEVKAGETNEFPLKLTKKPDA